MQKLLRFICDANYRSGKSNIASQKPVFAFGRPTFAVHVKYEKVSSKIKETLSFGPLICTLISESQGLEKSRSASNIRKISGPLNLGKKARFTP